MYILSENGFGRIVHGLYFSHVDVFSNRCNLDNCSRVNSMKFKVLIMTCKKSLLPCCGNRDPSCMRDSSV